MTDSTGCYGENVNMTYCPEKQPLLDRGWVLVYCHVRGGGELGRKWYYDGMGENKYKSFLVCMMRTFKKHYPKVCSWSGPQNEPNLAIILSVNENYCLSSCVALYCGYTNFKLEKSLHNIYKLVHNDYLCLQDLYACVDYVQSELNLSRPERTALIGRSAGALPVSMFCNLWPHKIQAALLQVTINRMIQCTVCIISLPYV